jgi:colanic acid biosynthesis glycosyl transferase WcaI
MYAGNVGFSQSLELMLHAARELVDDESVVFLVNGGGSAREALEREAAGLPNVRFAPYQPKPRLAEVLATGDVHVVPLKRGLAASSVPSKTYSILAAGRPLLASIDLDTEVARLVAQAGCGLAVPPDDPAAFLIGLQQLLVAPVTAKEMGDSGRAFVEHWVSPGAVAAAYEDLFEELRRRPTSPRRDQPVASHLRG